MTATFLRLAPPFCGSVAVARNFSTTSGKYWFNNNREKQNKPHIPSFTTGPIGVKSLEDSLSVMQLSSLLMLGKIKFDSPFKSDTELHNFLRGKNK